MWVNSSEEFGEDLCRVSNEAVAAFPHAVFLLVAGRSTFEPNLSILIINGLVIRGGENLVGLTDLVKLQVVLGEILSVLHGVDLQGQFSERGRNILMRRRFAVKVEDGVVIHFYVT